MANHSSILAWKIPWTEEPGGLQSTRGSTSPWGSQRVEHYWSDSAHTHIRSWLFGGERPLTLGPYVHLVKPSEESPVSHADQMYLLSEAEVCTGLGAVACSFPKITRVSFYFLCANNSPTLCNPMDYTVCGILQARILEWVTFPFSRGPSQPRGRTQVSHIAGGFFTSWATREAQEYWSG